MAVTRKKKAPSISERLLSKADRIKISQIVDRFDELDVHERRRDEILRSINEYQRGVDQYKGKLAENDKQIAIMLGRIEAAQRQLLTILQGIKFPAKKTKKIKVAQKPDIIDELESRNNV